MVRITKATTSAIASFFTTSLLLVSLLALSPQLALASKIREYVNPLDVSIADPQILKDDDGVYYLYGTTPHNSSDGFELYSSRNLLTWQRRGWCYQKTPDSWGQDNFWAPEVIKKGGVYYLFYTAYNPDKHVRNICVASTLSPLGMFQDIVTPLLDAKRGFIDASPFYDPASNRYYLYVMEENLRPPKIWVARLSEDFKSIDTPLTECLTATQSWEHGWVEGPFVIKQKGWYYMMYSGNGYGSPNYAVGYATAPSPTGPWTKFDGNPILHKNAVVSGPGHNSVVTSPDGRELFIVYHTHLTFAGGWQRQLAMDRLIFEPQASGPDRMTVLGAPTTTPQPLPSGAKPLRTAVSTEFNKPLDFNLWHTFGEHSDKWRQVNGTLQITTVDGDLFTNRTDASNIFLQYAPQGDFSIKSGIEFMPKADFEQAFLLVFKDQSNYIRISDIHAGGRKLEWAKETKGAFESSSIANPLPATQQVHFRITKNVNRYVIAYSVNEKDWINLGTYTADFGPQLQVGIGAYSPGSRAERIAVFDYFEIKKHR